MVTVAVTLSVSSVLSASRAIRCVGVAVVASSRPSVRPIMQFAHPKHPYSKQNSTFHLQERTSPCFQNAG